jgi:hypothetical protein
MGYSMVIDQGDIVFTDTYSRDIFRIKEEDVAILKRLPMSKRQEVSKNVHEYIQQVDKDYPERKNTDGSK